MSKARPVSTDVAAITIQYVGGKEVEPFYATDGACCADAFAAETARIPAHERRLVSLGFRAAIPQGWMIEICGRSGYAAGKHPQQEKRTTGGIDIHPGRIDSDYRGIIHAVVINDTDHPLMVEKGSRICQLEVRPAYRALWLQADTLPETARGEGGFGSTGTDAISPAGNGASTAQETK